MPRGKLVRQVNAKMTQRARNPVGVTPKRVRENTREATPRNPSRRSGKTAESVGGRGLSRAGPRRSGGQLTRAAIKRKTANNRAKGIHGASLPKSAVRQPKSEASQTTGGRQRLPGLSQMILRAVTHRGGVTLAELQQVLADGGYDVSKNNNRVSASLKRMVGKGTLLRRAGSYRLNSTQLKMSRAGEKMKTTAVITAKGTGSARRAGKAIKASKLKSKSSPARKPAKQARKSPAKGKKQAGKQMGRNATLATKAKKQTARKAKMT